MLSRRAGRRAKRPGGRGGDATDHASGGGPGAPAGAAIQPDDEALALVHGGEVLLIVPAGVEPEVGRRLGSAAARDLAAGASAATFETSSAPATPTPRWPRKSGARPARAGRPRKISSHAGDIMTREVLTTRPNVPVRELAKRLAYHRISGMLGRSGAHPRRRERGRHHQQAARPWPTPARSSASPRPPPRKRWRCC